MRSRFRNCVFVAAISALSCFVAAPAAVRAQTARTTLIVTVRDSATKAPVAGVEVRVALGSAAQRTDSAGRAQLGGFDPGGYTLEARRVGYRPLVRAVSIRGEDSIQIALALTSVPAELSPVIVQQHPVPTPLREFDERRKRGVGQFVTAAQIDSSFGASLDAIIVTRIRGLRVVGDNASGFRVMSLRPATEHAFSSVAGPCWPVVYLDGVQLADGGELGPDIAMADTWSIGGIEYYAPSEVPVQYKQSGALGGRSGGGHAATTSPSCGVMLIWTRP
jgi:carboxypeptidase family protein